MRHRIACPLLEADGTGRRRAVVQVGAGALGMFALLAGPWLLVLWRDWGNPVFPHFDEWFGGKWLLAGAARDLRFVPQDARQLRILASPELDDEVLDCSGVRQRVVEVEQAIFGSGKQNLWPFALDS
jgi:hypothetical protein